MAAENKQRQTRAAADATRRETGRARTEQRTLFRMRTVERRKEYLEYSSRRRLQRNPISDLRAV